jgi:hypothetical protein
MFKYVIILNPGICIKVNKIYHITLSGSIRVHFSNIFIACCLLDINYIPALLTYSNHPINLLPPSPHSRLGHLAVSILTSKPTPVLCYPLSDKVTERIKYRRRHTPGSQPLPGVHSEETIPGVAMEKFLNPPPGTPAADQKG